MIPYCNFYILDAAQIETELILAQKLNSDFRCLYTGESERTLKYVAPYLFSHEVGSDFSNWLIFKKQQSSLGYFINTKANVEQLYRHLRTLLFVNIEENEELYFRFYDPYVARIFLPTCDSMQISEFFGPINFLITETETPFLFKQYWHENGVLKEKEFEYRIDEIENFDDKISIWKKEIDEEQEQKDREEVEKINKLYNKEEKVIIPNIENQKWENIGKREDIEVAKAEELSNQQVISESTVTVDGGIEPEQNFFVVLPKNNSEKENKGWRLFD